MTWLVEGRSPVPVGGEACDPELAPVVTNRAPGVIDQAAPIPREHPAIVYGMKISKRIYSIGTRGGLGHLWEWVD